MKDKSMYKKHINFNSIPKNSEIVFVITLEADPLDDMNYPEVIAVFKDFDLVEHYLKEHNVHSYGSLLTSDAAENKQIKYIENIYEILVFNISTGEQII